MRTALTLTRQTALTLTRQHVRCSHSYQTHAHCSHSYQTDSTRSLSPNRQLSLLPDSTRTALTLTRQTARAQLSLLSETARAHSYQTARALLSLLPDRHLSLLPDTRAQLSLLPDRQHAHSSHSYQRQHALTLTRQHAQELHTETTSQLVCHLHTEPTHKHTHKLLLRQNVHELYSEPINQRARRATFWYTTRMSCTQRQCNNTLLRCLLDHPCMEDHTHTHTHTYTQSKA